MRGPGGARLSSLAPAFVEPLLRGRFGRPYFYPSSASRRSRCSTRPSRRARSRSRRADRRPRTAGPPWEAPAGSSVLFSVLLRPPPERRLRSSRSSPAVATAIAVERAIGLAAQIKWPNDVMLDRRKVAGGPRRAARRRGRARDRAERQPDARRAARDTQVAAGSLRTVDRPRARPRPCSRPAARARAALRRLARRRARRDLRRPRRARLPPRPPRATPRSSRSTPSSCTPAPS